MMETLDIDEAKARLLQLVLRAARGEDVVVSHNGKPLVRITRLGAPNRQVRFGVLKGKVAVASDFDRPLPDDDIQSYEGA